MEVIHLHVAGLGLWLDAQGTGLQLSAPAGHARFLQPTTSEGYQPSEVCGELVLRVRNSALPTAPFQGALLFRCETWELWLDKAGRYVFSAYRESPARRIAVDGGFTAGEVLGDFSSVDGQGFYPLQFLDIKLFANWLAESGDVMLHAAGVAVDGKGYCFAGPAGAGKSTLAAQLARDPLVTVLGEDQVVLRYLDGRFWIYGTPWHENPDMCSPLGAPLETLFFLDRTAPVGISKATPLAGVAWLMQTAFIPYYRPEAVSGILDRLALLAERVPFYAIHYPLGADALGFIRNI